MANGFSKVLGSRDLRFYDELEFMDKGEKNFVLDRVCVDADDTATSSGFEDFDEMNFDLVDDKRSRRRENSLREEDFVRVQSDVEDERFEKLSSGAVSRRGKQVIRRSN